VIQGQYITAQLLKRNSEIPVGTVSQRYLLKKREHFSRPCAKRLTVSKPHGFAPIFHDLGGYKVLPTLKKPVVYDTVYADVLIAESPFFKFDKKAQQLGIYTVNIQRENKNKRVAALYPRKLLFR
jgi:hypothetical protein